MRRIRYKKITPPKSPMYYFTIFCIIGFILLYIFSASGNSTSFTPSGRSSTERSYVKENFSRNAIDEYNNIIKEYDDEMNFTNEAGKKYSDATTSDHSEYYSGNSVPDDEKISKNSSRNYISIPFPKYWEETKSSAFSSIYSSPDGTLVCQATYSQMSDYNITKTDLFNDYEQTAKDLMITTYQYVAPHLLGKLYTSVTKIKDTRPDNSSWKYIAKVEPYLNNIKQSSSILSETIFEDHRLSIMCGTPTGGSLDAAIRILINVEG